MLLTDISKPGKENKSLRLEGKIVSAFSESELYLIHLYILIHLFIHLINIY